MSSKLQILTGVLFVALQCLLTEQSGICRVSLFIIYLIVSISGMGHSYS